MELSVAVQVNVDSRTREGRSSEIEELLVVMQETCVPSRTRCLLTGHGWVVTLWLSELVRTRVQLPSLLFSTVTDLCNFAAISKLFS